VNITGYNFEGPFDPLRGFTNQISAVYVIVDNQPKLLDVGQTDDLNNRFPNHPWQACWERNKAGNLGLYILQIADEQTRLKIELMIRTQYNPTCGER